MIHNGYIVKYTSNYEVQCYNQTQLARELRTCTKSIYTYFLNGFGNLKDLNVAEVLKVRNGVIVDRFKNIAIEKYNKKYNEEV